jgi:hypothetical protein
MPRKLRLVKPGEGASVFDDLNSLRAEQQKPVLHHRPPSTETFARFPHERATKLHQLSGSAWAVLVELDRQILKGRGRNPVIFKSTRLAALGLKDRTRQRALQQLETAGVIVVKQRGPGKSPLVTHLWFAKTP